VSAIDINWVGTHARDVSQEVARRSGLTHLTALVGLVLLVAACASPTAPHWADEGVHAVDGYWILTEHPCDLKSSDPCVEQVRMAESALGIDPTMVVGGAIAGVPSTWVRSDGRSAAVIGHRGQFVVLDLVGGTRRVTGYGCGGVQNPDGSMLCSAGPFEDYRVGQSPID
jgi:hypothetical protein